MPSGHSKTIGPDLHSDAPTVTVTRIDGFRLKVTGAEAELVVDLPSRQGGGGKAFASVELLLAALGTCMAGTMLGFAENQGVPVGDVSVSLRAVLAESPSRVERVEATMVIAGEVTQRQLASLRRVARRCKVHTTLERSPAVELVLEAPNALGEAGTAAGGAVPVADAAP